MKLETLVKRLSLAPMVDVAVKKNDVEGCYIGDLLSWVMGRASENYIWITVMGNVNAVAVAKLVGISAIVLCEDAYLDDEAALRALKHDIPIYQSPRPAYELALEVSKALATS